MFFDKVSDIDIRRDIIAFGIKAVVLDIDGTLRNRINGETPDDIRQWIRECRENKLLVCLLSNNFHSNVRDFADEMDLPLFSEAWKPSPSAFSDVMRELGTTPAQTIMIGNNRIADIVGAHISGMRAYLVRPIEGHPVIEATQEVISFSANFARDEITRIASALRS